MAQKVEFYRPDYDAERGKSCNSSESGQLYLAIRGQRKRRDQVQIP